MARGDPTFAKFDTSIRHGEKRCALHPAHRGVYDDLWMLCVEVQSDVLLVHRYSVTHLAHECEVTTRMMRAAIAAFVRVGLIEINSAGDIYVIGVKACHPKLSWRKCPIWGPNGEISLPHMGPELSPSCRHSESTRDPEKSSILYGTAEIGTGTPDAVGSRASLPDRPDKTPEPTERDLEIADELIVDLWPYMPEAEVDRNRIAIGKHLARYGHTVGYLALTTIKDMRSEGRKADNEQAYLMAEIKRVGQEQKRNAL